MQNTAGFRLSPQQSQLWFHQQEDAASFCAQCAILIEGKFDKGALQAALASVVARHESLRTSFQRRAGMKLPLQMIGEPASIVIAESDWSALPATEHLTKLEQAMIEQRRGAADLSTAAPLQATLCCLTPEKHVLLLSLPALCADGLSLNYCARELAHFYAGGGVDAQITAEPLQYADFSEWQNSLLEGDDEDARAGKAFWSKRANEDTPPLALPFARKPARNTKWVPDSIKIPLQATTSSGVEALAKAQSTTPALVLFTGWNVLLARLSGQQNLAVTFTPLERNHEEVLGAVGLYARALPVAVELDGALTFTQV
ncbi:MAG: hypothetical protein HY043_07960, partial [Verrucomicrobia bacterium]|nr:hypothetical protein [Verrucomicrobiota bacterium]